MANTKSAYKRIGIAERNKLRNKTYKSAIKTLLKKTLLLIKSSSEKDQNFLETLISLSYKKIDKAVQKGILHPNNGNSKKSSLSRALKNQKQEA